MSRMLQSDKARRFAEDWLGAWNSHDLDRIMAHYANDVEYHSPFVVRVTGDPNGRLTGKASVRWYVAKALAMYPDLRFRLRHLYEGADSIVVEYDSVDRWIACEVFVLDDLGQVRSVRCHYRDAAQEEQSTPLAAAHAVARHVAV